MAAERRGMARAGPATASQAGFVLGLALLAGLILSAGSFTALNLALASHQAQATEHRRRQAEDGLANLGQLLAQTLVGRRPEELNQASLSPQLLSQGLPGGWQLASLQWQASQPADLGVASLQVTLSGPRGEQRQGVVTFERSPQDGLITSLRQEGA